MHWKLLHYWQLRKEWNSKRKTKVSFGKTMMQVLELLCLVKNTSWDKAMLNSKVIKPVAKPWGY